MKMETTNLNKTIREIFESNYVVPLYQRNFTWGEEQIARLLRDVYRAYEEDKKSNYYIGTLVVRKRSDEVFEVIDGQQRLTVLCLIMRIIDEVKEQRLTYDSRPEVEEFLNSLYGKGYVSNAENSAITCLKEAVNTIKETILQEDQENAPSFETFYRDHRDFAKYFADNVILVRVEIPEDIDVSSYFEIMNNRGEQLQYHEILKANLIGRLKDAEGKYDTNKQKEFSIIWDACSQMNVPIQRLFDIENRKKYFGENYDCFKFVELASSSKKVDAEEFSIEDILKKSDEECARSTDDTVDNNRNDIFVNETDYSSIIDFPNFIMLVFRIFYDKYFKGNSKGHDNNEGSDNHNIPLDDKYLLKVYEDVFKKDDGSGVNNHDLSSEVFIERLFCCRTLFDRYIIKAVESPDNSDSEPDDENFSWSLKYTRYKDSKMYYENTFKDDSHQNRIVMVLSMLQVTFRSRKYKTWLCETLKWLYDNCDDALCIQPDAYIKFLDEFTLSRYEQLNQDLLLNLGKETESNDITKDNSLSLGRSTPHFLLNFIDYLYWVESKNSSNKIKNISYVKNFDFKYWNSVEHHLSVNKAQIDKYYKDYIDNLGNLFLLNRSSNSRLNDRDVKEKVQHYGNTNMGANRQIIYQLTKDNNYNWTRVEITNHYKDLIDLLSKRYAILGIQPKEIE